MDHGNLKNNVGKLVGQRNVFLVFSLILSVAVLLLSLLAFSKKERTIIVPTSGPAYWIEDRRVSSGYIEKMGLFLTDLLLNRSPADVDKRNKIILEYVHPSFYHECKKTLAQERESLLKSNQAIYFRADTSSVDPSQGAFVTEGEFFLLVGTEGKAPFCLQKEKKKYTLRFQCENGKLLLTSMKKEEV